MADELEKKPKPIGTPAPNYPKPKQESAPAQTQQHKLVPKQNQPFKRATVKPGSPSMPESVPVGVQQTKFESPKHVDKRVNKMFKETNQPTLGIWNKGNTNPMSAPDKIRFNPKLNYKPSKEALEAANRKKIMNAGFAPKNWDGKSDIKEPSLEQQFKDMKDFAKKQDEGLAKYLERPEVKIMNRYNQLSDDQKKDFALNVYHYGTDEFDNPLGKFRDPYTGEIMYADAEDNYADKSDYLLGKDEDSRKQLLDAVKHLTDNGLSEEETEKLFSEYPAQDLEPWDDDEESDERSKASELYGTDLNKQQGYDYDRLSKELDSGDWVNLDAGLLPYEYGFETNGHEDLAVDARKNPETGKYEVFMYPETDLGPVEEPDENYPNYEFDSFDDLKAFMENNYKKVEKPKWDPVNEPGSGGVTKELIDFVREQLKADGGLNDNFIDAYLSKMPQNSNQADYWKGKYQEAWNKKYGGNK